MTCFSGLAEYSQAIGWQQGLEPAQTHNFCMALQRLFTPLLENRACDKVVSINPQITRIRIAQARCNGIRALAGAKHEVAHSGFLELECALIDLFAFNGPLEPNAHAFAAGAVEQFDMVVQWLADAARKDRGWIEHVPGRAYSKFSGCHNGLGVAQLAAKEYKGFRIPRAAAECDYTFTDDRIAKWKEPGPLYRMVRILTPHGLRCAGAVLQNCLNNPKHDDHVDQINYEDELSSGGSDFYVLCGRQGDMHACIQLENSTGRVAEVGEKQSGHARYYARPVMAFMADNDLQPTQKHYRTGLVRLDDETLIPISQLKVGHVVPGSLNLRKISYQPPLDGVVVHGNVNFEEAEITRLPGVIAREITLYRCANLKEISQDLSTDILHVDNFIRGYLPPIVNVGQVHLKSGRVIEPMSWSHYRNKCYEQSASLDEIECCNFG